MHAMVFHDMGVHDIGVHDACKSTHYLHIQGFGVLGIDMHETDLLPRGTMHTSTGKKKL